jgi:hypothetical protein
MHVVSGLQNSSSMHKGSAQGVNVGCQHIQVVSLPAGQQQFAQHASAGAQLTVSTLGVSTNCQHKVSAQTCSFLACRTSAACVGRQHNLSAQDVNKGCQHKVSTKLSAQGINTRCVSAVRQHKMSAQFVSTYVWFLACRTAAMLAADPRMYLDQNRAEHVASNTRALKHRIYTIMLRLWAEPVAAFILTPNPMVANLKCSVITQANSKGCNPQLAAWQNAYDTIQTHQCIHACHMAHGYTCQHIRAHSHLPT